MKKIKLRRPHPIRWFRDWRRYRRERRDEKIVEKALRRLFMSHGEDRYALRTLIEHALGRRMYDEELLQELAIRSIYGDMEPPL